MDDLKAEVEAMLGLPVGESTKTHQSVTGEEYITLFSGGRWEKNRVPAWYATPRLATDAYVRAIRQYADAQRKGVLYWRVSPEISTFVSPPIGHHPGNTLYTVYSRLLISDKPVVKAAA